MAKKKAKKKAAPKKKAATKEVLIVGSKVKNAIKASGAPRASSDVLEALNELVHWHIGQAAARANSNGRQTVRGHDFLVI